MFFNLFLYELDNSDKTSNMDTSKNSENNAPKEYEVKIERIQADGHLNDRTIRKYRALAIEFEEFLDILSDDGKRSWREVFTENIHTMTSSNDPVKYDAAQNSMRKVLTGYLANLKAPDGRSYGASSYCVRRSAIRWYVEREYGYEMSRTRGWNNIFKVVHTIKNSYNNGNSGNTTPTKNSSNSKNSDKTQNSSSISNSSSSTTLTNLTLLPTTTAQPVILSNPSNFMSTSFMPYIKQQNSNSNSKNQTVLRSNSPKSITIPKTITLNPIQTHLSNLTGNSNSSSSVSPASAITQITQVTHGFLEEDLHRIFDLFYTKDSEEAPNVMNNPVLACSYLYFQLTAHFNRFLDFPVDETLKINELKRTNNGLTLSDNLLKQFENKIADYKNSPDKKSSWKTIPNITDNVFLAVYDNYILKRKISLPQHPDYRDPGKLFLVPVSDSFLQESESPNVNKVLKLDKSQRWFTCCPHSKTSIGQIVPTLCKLGKLSKLYTNASLKYLPRSVDLEEISNNYGLEFLGGVKNYKISKVSIKTENGDREELSTPPPAKKVKISKIETASPPSYSNGNDDGVLIRQVLVNQQTIMNNQASLEETMEKIVDRIENIEKQLPKLKAQQRRRAVMCRRGMVTIRWHQIVPRKKKRKRNNK